MADDNDDGDQWTDTDEVACGTNPKDSASIPLDGDVDGICDALDEKVLGYSKNGTRAKSSKPSSTNRLHHHPQLERYGTRNMVNLPGPPCWTGIQRHHGTFGRNRCHHGYANRGLSNDQLHGVRQQQSDRHQFTFAMAVLADTDGDGLPDNESVTASKLIRMTTTTVFSMRRS